MKQKKWILFFVPLLVLIGIIHFIDKKQADHFVKEWKTYKKENHSTKITGRQSTKKELRRAHIPESNNREPSSVRPMRPIRHNRELVGPGSRLYADDINRSLEMVNEVSKDWKDKLGHELLRFHEPETKVMIKSEKSFIDVKKDKGRFIEQVIVTYIMPDGRQNSYKANVDSESGKIIQTWGRTIHENIGKKPLRMEPSGSL